MSNLSLNTNESLKDQMIGGDPDAAASGTYYLDSALVSGFEGTWFDFFADQATSQAKSLLSFCEEAKVRGIELDEEDLASIDSTIESISTTAMSYGYNTNTYLANVYGKGVKESDVRKAMELEALASKCATVIQEEILDGITDEEIDEEYASNKLDYNVIDYTQLELRVDFDDVAEEVLGADYTAAELEEKESEVLDAYKAKIAELKKTAEDFEKLTKAEDFEKAMYEYLANKYYDDKLEALDLADEDLPAEADAATIKSKMIETVIAEILEEKDTSETDAKEADEKWTIYDIEITKTFATAAETLKLHLFDSLTTDKEKNIVDKANHADDGDDENTSFLEWAFEDGRAAGNTKTILDGAGVDKEEITADDTYFTATVYLLRKAQYLDEELTRNLAYAVFSSTNDADAAIAALKAGELSVETFAAIVEEKGATANSIIEDYSKGSMGVADFDKWLYDDETEKGAITESAIVADSAFLVAYYYEDGNAQWYVTVKNALFSEKYQVEQGNLSTKFEIKVKDSVINRIDA